MAKKKNELESAEVSPVENTGDIDLVPENTDDIENAGDKEAIDDIIEDNVDIETIVSDIDDAINELSGKEHAVNYDVLPEIDINSNRPVICKSVFFGKLVYVNPVTQSKRVWKEYGAVITMPFSEFQAMHNNKPEYIEHPYIVIGDKDIIAYYNLHEKYSGLYRITKLDRIILSGNLNLVRKELRGLAEIGLQDTIIASIRKLRKDKILNNKDVMDVIKEEFKLELE